MDEERVKNLIKNLIIEIGEDPTREGLRDTPKRIAKMYKEIFGGYESDSQIGVQFSEDSDTVIVKNIEFYSMCEHHMLPFFGKINISCFKIARFAYDNLGSVETFQCLLILDAPDSTVLNSIFTMGSTCENLKHEDSRSVGTFLD